MQYLVSFTVFKSKFILNVLKGGIETKGWPKLY
jgi:hypothetical protein